MIPMTYTIIIIYLKLLCRIYFAHVRIKIKKVGMKK